LPAAQQNLLIKKLCGYEMKAKGKTTFKDEFVTAGGIDTSEIGTDTMASKKMPNLFFAGEIMNVDGITGGYNFQHAWTSGFAAAHGIAQAASLL
jgi:predicted flavoprotein YhiN